MSSSWLREGVCTDTGDEREPEVADDRVGFPDDLVAGVADGDDLVGPFTIQRQRLVAVDAYSRCNCIVVDEVDDVTAHGCGIGFD
jgi:hypothetical protein